MGLLPPNLKPQLDTLRTDLAVETLRNVLKDGWGPLALLSGIADAFTDQTGVSALGGATYDASGHYLHNTGGTSLIAQATGTAIGTATGGSGLAAAFDGSLTGATTGGTAIAASNLGYIGKDYGSAGAYTVSKAEVFGSTDYGLDGGGNGTMTLTLLGSDTNNPATATAFGTWTGADSSDATMRTITASSPAACRYWWVKAQVASAGGSIYFNEVRFYQTVAPANVSAVGAAQVPAAAVTEVRIVALWEPVDSCTLGTDCLVDVSADGGVTWSAVTLSDLGKYDATTRIIGGLAAVASGSSVQWRWRTANAKTQRLHGVWEQWR